MEETLALVKSLPTDLSGLIVDFVDPVSDSAKVLNGLKFACNRMMLTVETLCRRRADAGSPIPTENLPFYLKACYRGLGPDRIKGALIGMLFATGYFKPGGVEELDLDVPAHVRNEQNWSDLKLWAPLVYKHEEELELEELAQFEPWEGYLE